MPLNKKRTIQFNFIIYNNNKEMAQSQTISSHKLIVPILRDNIEDIVQNKPYIKNKLIVLNMYDESMKSFEHCVKLMMQNDISALEFFDAGMDDIVKVFENIFNTEGWVVDSFRTSILNIREAFVLVFKRRCDAYEKFKKGLDRMQNLVTKMLLNNEMVEYNPECLLCIGGMDATFKNMLIVLDLKF
ncbi:MAG: hypothetical protein Satyrvirus6_27 [Satyrvirus sp.]|uniref:Uncharacterized protein n=1 Tax=Satyrvirus sp. TaxID=2487771 RepID=A0A3G5AD96_9VIRU|nr:MAG: hypothetical protein Satyrvirus6_27 [Satyrvirus sp.]